MSGHVQGLVSRSRTGAFFWPPDFATELPVVITVKSPVFTVKEPPWLSNPGTSLQSMNPRKSAVFPLK